MSALQFSYGSQFTLSAHLINPNFCLSVKQQFSLYYLFCHWQSLICRSQSVHPFNNTRLTSKTVTYFGKVIILVYLNSLQCKSSDIGHNFVLVLVYIDMHIPCVLHMTIIGNALKVNYYVEVILQKSPLAHWQFIREYQSCPVFTSLQSDMFFFFNHWILSVVAIVDLPTGYNSSKLIFYKKC